MTQLPIVDQFCDCGLKSLVRKVQNNGPNYGRTYQACPKPCFEARCSFFQFCGAVLEVEEHAASAKKDESSQKTNWVKKTSSSGQSYYYNSLSGASQWGKPN